MRAQPAEEALMLVQSRIPPSVSARCRSRRALVLALIGALLISGSVLGQGMPSGEYGAIALGGSVEGTIAAATQQELVFHTYVVQVPDGSGPVTIQVNGLGADLDLAVKVGSPIVDYDDVDYIDTSEDPNPVHTVQNAAGTVIYLDVMNLVPQAASYTVTVSAADGPPAPRTGPTRTPSPGGNDGAAPSGAVMPSGEVGPIAIGSSVTGTIEAAGDAGAFHTYWIDVPQAGTDLTIAVDGMGSDLDLALKVGAPITDYQDVDYIDTSEDPNPVVVIEGVVAGRIYVDVLNLLPQPANYRLSVRAGVDSAPQPTPSPGGGANPLAGDPLLGSFAGDGLEVVVQGGDGRYVGELVLNGQRFPFEATGGAGGLEGAFASGGQTFAFRATLSGDTLTVESGGSTYRTQRTSGGAPSPSNPLGPGGGSQRPGTQPPSNDVVLAEAPYGTLTQDNALAFFEALVFAHEQVGFPVNLSDAELNEYISLVAQAYPTFTPDEQLALSMSREIWMRVQANWAEAAPTDQQEFVIGMLAMWYGDQQVQAWIGSGSGGGGQGGACSDIDACFSQYASPEAYADATNAQSCWAAAGCTDYDPSYNEFTYEDYSYDSYDSY